jgi:hypothetical protein
MILIIPVAILVALIFFFLIPSEPQKAKKVVDAFYTYEQNAQFSAAYDQFHPKMQERNSRGRYIENRGKFVGVEGFPYSLSKPKKVKDWSMSEGSEPFETSYKVTVTKEIRDQDNGNYRLEQDVYVTQELETNDWKILWDFNE